MKTKKKIKDCPNIKSKGTKISHIWENERFIFGFLEGLVFFFETQKKQLQYMSGPKFGISACRVFRICQIPAPNFHFQRVNK
jgi:hypothetical protein